MEKIRSYFDMKLNTFRGHKVQGNMLAVGSQTIYIIGWIHGLMDAGVIDNDTMTKWFDEVNSI
jgi:hypothetical protein